MALLKAVQTLTSESLALMVLRNIPWVSWVGTEIGLTNAAPEVTVGTQIEN